MAKFSGYNDDANTKPNSAWWLQQIEMGVQWRKEQACEERWSDWRDYYRSEYTGDVMPVNIIFSVLNSLVPKVYFRNPTVSLTPGVSGMEATLFARILQRLDGKLYNRMGIKQQMKRIIRDSFMFGTGIGKLGFGGRFSPGIKPYSGNAKNNNIVEYSFLENNMPWFQRVSPGDFVVPYGTTFLDEDTRWVAYRNVRMLDDVKDDERFVASVRKDLSATEELNISNIRVPMVALWEIQDRKTGMAFVLADKNSGKDALYAGPDEMQKIVRFSGMPLIFNENDNVFWGVPDTKILEPYQRELNETNTQIMKHRRLSVVKILATTGMIDESEVEKLVSEEVGPVTWVKGDVNSAVKIMEAGTIPRELMEQMQNIQEVIRATIGFSRNQAGEYNSQTAETTATEANIVQQAAEIRIDERRDMAADLLVEMTAGLHEIMFQTMDPEMVTDMTGPYGGLIWVKFSKDLIKKGRYTVNIDPDSMMPQTQESRQQRAMQNYEFLAVNPYLDPLKLTMYLMTEMVGPQFDDMMRGYDPFALMAQAGIPMGTGQTAENPMNMDQVDQANKAAATQPLPNGQTLVPQQVLANQKG